MMSTFRRYFDPICSQWYAQRSVQPTHVQATELQIYLRLDDVYSYLAVQLLSQIDEILVDNIKPLHIFIAKETAPPPNTLNQSEWQNYSLQDAKILALQHGFNYNNVSELPNQTAIEQVYSILEHSHLTGRDFLHLLEDVYHILWQQQHHKLNTLYLQAKQRTKSEKMAFSYTEKPLLHAYFDFAQRHYHAVDDVLRLTRRLRQLKLFTAPPIFLINHIEWGEHLIQGVEEIADIQALQPKLDLYIALEDPMSWLILAYIKAQFLDYYNIKLNIYPIEYQGKDHFNWYILYRLAQRMGIKFAPFCRPTATTCIQIAKLFYHIDEDKKVSALYYLLQAVWTEGKDLSYAKHFNEMKQQLNISEFKTQDIYQKLRENTTQCSAQKQPNLPVFVLHIDHQEYIFNSVYRLWLIESIFSRTLEQHYKSQVNEP